MREFDSMYGVFGQSWLKNECSIYALHGFRWTSHVTLAIVFLNLHV